MYAYRAAMPAVEHVTGNVVGGDLRVMLIELK